MSFGLKWPCDDKEEYFIKKDHLVMVKLFLISRVFLSSTCANWKKKFQGT